VLDTGIDANHPDLRGQVAETADFSSSPYGVADVQGHGTHCAGIIAGRENDIGVVGICPDLAEHGGGLLIGKVLGDNGSGQSEWVTRGIRWAMSEGAHVISMSLGSPQPDVAMHAAIQEAVKSGVAVIAAAGNDGRRTFGNQVNYPGRYPETITVGAIGEDRVITEFSSRGPEVDIAAPGEEILSSVPGGKWVRMSGTSMATPFVAGVVGLVLSLDATAGHTDRLRRLLYAHAEDVGEPGRDPRYGAGLIRPDRMMDAISDPTTAPRGILLWIPGGEVRIPPGSLDQPKHLEG
jgi:subtilisin family serine protease